MRISLVLAVVLLCGAVATAAPIRPPRVADEPPLVGQTLAVSLNDDGALVVPGRAPLTKAEDMKSFLESQIGRIKKVAEAKKVAFAPSLDLGADSGAAWARIVELLDLAQEAGFQNVRVKASKKR
ncbi:MAG TPA: hypothetical protein VKD71_05625 [Gemmataceae bacterium]|nr:hypothetical protein [Gemmataceae bacterium]